MESKSGTVVSKAQQEGEMVQRLKLAAAAAEILLLNAQFRQLISFLIC